jgi:hypothetical protein
MTLTAALCTGRPLVAETFRQALANGIFWLMLGIGVLCVGACLTVEAAEGKLSLAFGAVSIPYEGEPGAAVRVLQLQLAVWVAAAAGLLLALIWTAGFVPAFLEPEAAAVLLAKPVPRWYLLAGKYLGVLTFVGLQIGVFFLGTWLALGARTGVWDAAYLLGAPLLLAQFAVFFSFSTLLAVTTRSTAACVFGSLVFWFLCWGLNYGRHAVVLRPEFEQVSALLRTMADAAYWLLPKPADVSMTLFETLQGGESLGDLLGTQALRDAGAFHPGLSLASSGLFAAGMLAASAHQLAAAEY